MIPDLHNALQHLARAFVPAVLGIMLHEVAHGWAAYKMGDPTAKRTGRLTLNPIRHIDPLGLGVFVFTALAAPFTIGWAKPVPIQPRLFRNPRAGIILVSLAGPLANFLVACLCALIFKLVVNLLTSGFSWSGALFFIAESARDGMFINVALAWFNLMPIPPLDGSHILAGLLPAAVARMYVSLARFGMVIVILLVAAGLLRRVLVPLMIGSIEFIDALFNLGQRM
ncbi:MAG: site-2 protease family protein [Desulfovibrio sp.]|jgi:Zn-dependent protease|nr:site-2 protease family protein [Desulfovibrio sp.]